MKRNEIEPSASDLAALLDEEKVARFLPEGAVCWRLVDGYEGPFFEYWTEPRAEESMESACLNTIKAILSRSRPEEAERV